MKVACLWHATQDELNFIRSSLPADTVVTAPQGQYDSRFESSFVELDPITHDADALLAWAIPRGVVENAKKLKFLSWMHSGVDDLGQLGILGLAIKNHFRIANIRGANSIAVAEQAMMFVLCLAKKTLRNHKRASDGTQQFPLWDPTDRSGMLSGRRLAVVGVGEIGASVAKRAKAFDMEVIGVRRHKERPVEYVDHMYGPADLTAILPDCDYVVLATPQTEETQELFGAEEISAMKKGAYLINVGRGGLIKERPLYDALVSEHLGGFATDVWWKYEYGAAFPNGWGSRLNIQKLPNVVLSWHEAHNADDVLERNLELGTQNLRQFLAGQPVCREINLELGY